MLKKMSPQDKLAAELEKIIREAQDILTQYRAATAKETDSRPVSVTHPRTGKKFTLRRREKGGSTGNEIATKIVKEYAYRANGIF